MLKSVFIFISLVPSFAEAWGSNPDKWTPVYQKKALEGPPKEVKVTKAPSVSRTSAGSTEPKASTELRNAYEKEYQNKNELMELKKNTLKLGGAAVPVLVDVMKNLKLPEKNRWIATFLLGRIMGKKASPFIAKFLSHPDWIMRIAALKTLLSLKEVRYGHLFAEKLKDSSYIVRIQALDNMAQLGLSEYAPHIWAMLFDKSNYTGTEGKLKRSNIIKTAIKTLGDLKYQKVKSPLLSMIQEKKYDDIFEEMDYTLGRLTGKGSPEGSKTIKKIYWGRVGIGEKEF